MVKKRKVTVAAFMAFLIMIELLLPAALPVDLAKAATETKGYLILAEEKDGTWSSYENCVEVKSEDKLLIKASAIAEAIGITYKKTDAKHFTLSNGKKINTYTKNAIKYQYSKGGSTVTKKAAYQPYTSKTFNAMMVEYSSLKTLVNVKYYDKSKAGDYQDLGYQGVICFSKYNKITELPELEEGTRVTTEKELRDAAADLTISIINIAADITLTEDFTYEREDNAVTINIKKGKTFTINKDFIPVGGAITNNGKIIVSGCFERGICSLVNNGSIVIEKGGSGLAGMSDLNNYGSITVAKGAELIVDRGSQFFNYGKINNDGQLSIDNGGSVTDKGGKIINNGTIDLYSYFNGDISLITGSGTLNDHREAATE